MFYNDSVLKLGKTLVAWFYWFSYSTPIARMVGKGIARAVSFSYVKKGGEILTDVYCEKKHCLNNRKGWCKAHAIRMDGMCRSYAPPDTLIKSKTPKIRKENRRYKRPSGDVLK